MRTLNANPHEQVDDRDPDGPLIVRMASGDQEAVREITERHMAGVYGLAYRLLLNRQDAEDVTQETFVRVWTHASRWEPGRAKFGTWIHRVAVNLCYDRLRRRREVLVDELPEQVDGAALPDVVMEQRALSDQVQKAVRSLPERQRVAVTLCHFQDLGNIEAASVMEISVEALESLLSRGRRKLRQALVETKKEFKQESQSVHSGQNV